MLQYILTVCVFIHVTKCYDFYKLPNPTFESFKPKGFRMTIPDEPGIQMVAFFVNLNQALGNTNGEYTKYIVQPTNDLWVYENTVLRLKKNDKIYVKILVLKKDVQYIKDDIDPFVVTDGISSTMVPLATPTSILATSTSSTTRKPTTGAAKAGPNILDVAEILTMKHSPASMTNTCSESLTNITSTLLDFEEQLIDAKEDAEILKSIVSRGPQTVQIHGVLAQGYTTQENFESILNQKLHLKNIKLKSATKYSNYVEVTLLNVDDKLVIIKSARRYLGGQSQQINVIFY